jgi:hypothetical protein
MLPGLETEANTVRTRYFAQITAQLHFTTTFHGTMVVAGADGAGKRFPLMTCLQEQPLPHHVVVLPATVSAKDMVQLIYEAVHANDDVFALRDMQDELIETLSGEPRIIVIDGVDRLSQQAADQLHYLHGRANATWALVLLGGPKAVRAITTSAALRGDVIAAVEILPLTGDELLRAVRGLHQLFLTPPDELILTVDMHVCRGRMKNWARFLQGALYLRRLATDRGEEPPTLDVDLAKAVVALMPTLKTPKRR